MDAYNNSMEESYDKLIGNEFKISEGNNTNNDKNITLYIPIQFYFCRNYNLSLPLIALVNDNINIKLQLNKLSSLYNKVRDITITPKINNVSSFKAFSRL